MDRHATERQPQVLVRGINTLAGPHLTVRLVPRVRPRNMAVRSHAVCCTKNGVQTDSHVGGLHDHNRYMRVQSRKSTKNMALARYFPDEKHIKRRGRLLL